MLHVIPENQTWENTLDFLNACNCCERHKVDMPTRYNKWYDRGDPRRNLDNKKFLEHSNWRAYIKYCFPCSCNCRQLARTISRDFRKCKRERCSVRDELKKKYHSIIENTTECPICFRDFRVFDKIYITTLDLCGHTYCKKCISKWFGNKQSIECPICRTTNWSNTLHIGTWNQFCDVYY
jgi:hypothetical protein